MDSPAAAADVAAYWTPERMRSAIPMDAPKSTPGTARATGKPTGGPGTIEAAPPSVASKGEDRQPAGGSSRQVTESQTVGKVFFFSPSDGFNHVCSASTVNSVRKRLVMTAGHCVHDGPGGQWMQNWVFVPRYRYGATPFGIWTAANLTSRTAWVDGGSFEEDMAIAIMEDLGGQRIVDVVGGNGLNWNWSYEEFVTILGYPADPPFSGEEQYYCESFTYAAHFLAQEVRATCDMNGGSSGSPWLMNYNSLTGIGFTNSVVSHRHLFASTIDGPYFDDDIKALYDFAESGSR